uniref:Reverse transcriptase domain-containing protein n=1 Tax=Tanacetum cinerariifolium TaxID=118510 RepID=A0A6L2KQW2_TANCI|nr:reverse transcriptase domain-containing protein [Tanacetum cinerariifolium]
MIQNKVPPKLKDPRSFLIPCNLNKAFSCNALAAIGASINLMPYLLYAKLSLETLKPIKMSVRLANRSFQYPVGVTKNMLVEVGKFTFLVDFVILEMEEDSKVPLILGRPFLYIVDAVIRVKQKQLNLGVGTQRMIFNIDSAMKHSYLNDDTCFSIDVIDEILEEDFDALLGEGSKILHSIDGTYLKEEIIVEFDEFMAMTTNENSDSEFDTEEPPFKKITIDTDYKIKTSLKEPPTNIELKLLPDNLEYVFLEEPSFLPCGNILIHGTCLKCNSGTRNSFTYDPILESFDEVQVIPNLPLQCHFNIYLCQICESNSHHGYECWQQAPLVYEPKPCYTQNFSDNDYSHDFPEKKIEEEQAANAQYWKIPAYCDDDGDYNFAITSNEPVDSLGMGDEHLNTIPATESDEFIKSSVENLFPNPSESEGENGCDVPACFTTFLNILFDADYDFYSSDDQSLSNEDFSKEIYSNPLFDEEIISMKIDQHHFNAESDLIESLLNHDSFIIPSSLKIDSLLDEFSDKLTLLKSILSGIDKTDCYPENEIRLTKRLLYDNSSPRPPEEFISENSYDEIESFSPSPIPMKDSNALMEEIDLSFNPDYLMPPSIKDDDYDSERDILILEELLDNYSLSLLENESFHFDTLSFSHPLAKPPHGNTGILNIRMMGDISEQKVPMPRLMITRVSNQEKSPDLIGASNFFSFMLNAR